MKSAKFLLSLLIVFIGGALAAQNIPDLYLSHNAPMIGVGGQNHLEVKINNNNNISGSGNFVLVLKGGLKIQTVTGNPQVTGDTLTWSFSGITDAKFQVLDIYFSWEQTVLPGTNLCVDGWLQPSTAENSIADHAFSICTPRRDLYFESHSYGYTGSCLGPGDSVRFGLRLKCSLCVPTDSISVDFGFTGDQALDRKRVPFDSAKGRFEYAYDMVFPVAGKYSMAFSATSEFSLTHFYTSNLRVFDHCRYISGKVYFDNNNNCAYDQGDEIFNYNMGLYRDGKLEEIRKTGPGGEYEFSAKDNSAYTVRPIPYKGNFSILCPLRGEYDIETEPLVDKDFAIGKGIEETDLWVDMTSGFFRPGRTSTIQLFYGNRGNTPSPSVIEFIPDDLISFVSSTPAPDSTSGNRYYWKAFQTPHTSKKIIILTETKTSAQIGNVVCNKGSVSLNAMDYDPGNNYDEDCEGIRNSYDPNMKEVYPLGAGASGEIPPLTELEYTVHFQNTGNDVAYDIYVMDTLDASLDPASFEVISYSHPMEYSLKEGQILRFDFKNIMLADSHSNEPLSHGFVKYRVKVKPGMPHGRRIQNTAHIYFDLNPAIVTNTTLNTIAISQGIGERSGPEMKLFPNPASASVTLDLHAWTGETEIQLFDVRGTLLMNKTIRAGRYELMLDSVAPGLYFIAVSGMEGASRQRLVVHR